MEKFDINVNNDYNKGTYLNANEAWTALYHGLNLYGDESAPRGQKVRETLECDIKILNPMDNLVYSKSRALSPYYIAGEYEWYKSASNKASDIEGHSKFWKKIANPDGTVNSGYGYYIFKEDENGVTEFDKTIEILRKDPDSRQAVLQIPIMINRGKSDTPCTSSIQFILRNNKLNCTVYMRSNDIWLGFPYDVFNFTMWQIEIAKKLGVELGWYRHVVGSLHVYESQFIENTKNLSFETLDNEIYENVEDKFTESFLNDLKILDKKIDAGISSEILRNMVLHYKFLK